MASLLQSSLVESIQSLRPRIVEQRRDFHRHPELAFEEVRTSAAVLKWLESLGLEIERGIGKTGVIARLRGAKPGRVIALRADMDALPIQEANEFEFKSQNPGKMHACGHDAHTAMLLGVASVLAERRESLAGEVRFVFQPAEEGAGGAKPMIEGGALDGVDVILGQHMGPHHDTGTIAVSRGAAMAAADFWKLTISGKGGHGAYPHLSIDTIPVGAAVVMALQTIVSRTVDPLTSAVVTIGTFRGGFRNNVIAPQVELTGTVRTLDPILRGEMPSRVERIVRGICEAHGATYELDYTLNYPPTINHEGPTRFLEKVAGACVGEKNVKLVEPSMGGEDFAFYLERVPGVFYWLGCRRPPRHEGSVETAHLHSPLFDLDEDALVHGVHVMASAALTYLERGLEI
ncbi:MAG: M20 metallopeptidase family protein [Polyangiales bacterium]